MARYIIFRSGSNAANQSGLQEMILGVIEAPSYKQAKGQLDNLPREGWFHCYNNQHLAIEGFTSYRRRKSMSADTADRLIFEAQRHEDELESFQSDMERLHE